MVLAAPPTGRKPVMFPFPRLKPGAINTAPPMGRSALASPHTTPHHTTPHHTTPHHTTPHHTTPHHIPLDEASSDGVGSAAYGAQVGGVPFPQAEAWGYRYGAPTARSSLSSADFATARSAIASLASLDETSSDGVGSATYGAQVGDTPFPRLKPGVINTAHLRGALPSPLASHRIASHRIASHRIAQPRRALLTLHHTPLSMKHLLMVLAAPPTGRKSVVSLFPQAEAWGYQHGAAYGALSPHLPRFSRFSRLSPLLTQHLLAVMAVMAVLAVMAAGGAGAYGHKKSVRGADAFFYFQGIGYLANFTTTLLLNFNTYTPFARSAAATIALPSNVASATF